jgi:peptide deformylase
MSILKIARMGNPVLRKKGREVSKEEIKTKEFQKFIDDMVETLHEYGGVGLAAPQVHESVQVMIIELQPVEARPELEPFPLTFFINPKYTYMSDETEEDWEGCLSVPDMRGRVKRSKNIKVKALDRDGKEFELEASDFKARVIQHEGDHLIGKLYIDRMEDLKSLTFLDEYARFWGGDRSERD